MYISQYMTKNPKTISQEMSLADAREILNKYKFRHLPVVDDENKLIGIVTDRDLRSAFPSSVNLEGRESSFEMVKDTPVKKIMVSDCTYISPYDTIDDTLLVFERVRVGALPVLDDDKKVLGMFSIRDLAAAYKKLFGMSEKGSVLIAIEDEGGLNCMSSLVLLLEEQKIPFTRLLRIPASEETEGGHRAKIYLRVNTYNVAKVNKSLQDAGFTLVKPKFY